MPVGKESAGNCFAVEHGLVVRNDLVGVSTWSEMGRHDMRTAADSVVTDAAPRISTLYDMHTAGGNGTLCQFDHFSVSEKDIGIESYTISPVPVCFSGDDGILQISCGANIGTDFKLACGVLMNAPCDFIFSEGKIAVKEGLFTCAVEKFG